MSLIPIDNYPDIEASGIPRNASIWVQFNKSLEPNTVSYVTVSVVSPELDFIPLDGDVIVRASDNGVANSIVEFSPDTGYNAFTRYSFFIQGGNNGIRAYDGDSLANNLEYSFVTSSGTVDNPDVPATGVPEISGVLHSGDLTVLSTYPSNYDTNISNNLKYIKIQFNDVIPSGTNLYDMINITSKDVL